MTEELKPCPFCGEAPQDKIHGVDNAGTALHIIRCVNRACGTWPSTDVHARWERAADAWNTRAAPSQPEGAEPVGHFLRAGFDKSGDGTKRWEQVADEFAGDPDVVALYLHPSQSAGAAAPDEGNSRSGFATRLDLCHSIEEAQGVRFPAPRVKGPQS